MSTQNERTPMDSLLAAIGSDDFQTNLTKVMPAGVGVDRFTQTTIVAIQHNPRILEADRQSLFNAISKAAADGLMPDGKEGALVPYNQKYKDRNGRDAYLKVVRWTPMVEGVIKLLGKAGITAYAVSVYENDEIDIWNDDDGQHVKHRPNPFKDRGKLVGVFAVARLGERTFVEAMNIEEIERVRASSRSGEGGPWEVWYDRMAQKSALHRIKKRVPIFNAEITTSLIDPEEDPELAPAAEVKAIEHKARDEVLQPAAQRRPRGLQAVMDRSEDPVAAPAQAKDAGPPPDPIQPGEDVF